MATLADIYFKKETLKTLLDTIEAKRDKGVAITVSLSDDTNDYGQNVTSYVSQSKEEREAKKSRYYVANGKVFWTDGKVTIAEKKASTTQTPQNDGKEESSELPF
jgi:hypothetical protein